MDHGGVAVFQLHIPGAAADLEVPLDDRILQGHVPGAACGLQIGKAAVLQQRFPGGYLEEKISRAACVFRPDVTGGGDQGEIPHNVDLLCGRRLPVSPADIPGIGLYENVHPHRILNIHIARIGADADIVPQRMVLDLHIPGVGLDIQNVRKNGNVEHDLRLAGHVNADMIIPFPGVHAPDGQGIVLHRDRMLQPAVLRADHSGCPGFGKILIDAAEADVFCVSPDIDRSELRTDLRSDGLIFLLGKAVEGKPHEGKGNAADHEAQRQDQDPDDHCLFHSASSFLVSRALIPGQMPVVSLTAPFVRARLRAIHRSVSPTHTRQAPKKKPASPGLPLNR